MANERDTGQGPASDEMKQRLERETATARDKAQNLGETVQQQAQEISSNLQSEAQRLASEQKQMATSSLSDLASAIRNAADELERRQQTQVASMARTLAGGLEDFSQSISKRNFQDMMSDVQRFARDHPAVFFGGALLAGLAVARFAKSTTPQRSHPEHRMRDAGYTGQPSRDYAGTGMYGSRYAAPQRAGQTGPMPEYARREGEHGRGFDTGTTR